MEFSPLICEEIRSIRVVFDAYYFSIDRRVISVDGLRLDRPLLQSSNTSGTFPGNPAWTAGRVDISITQKTPCGLSQLGIIIHFLLRDVVNGLYRSIAPLEKLAFLMFETH